MLDGIKVLSKIILTSAKEADVDVDFFKPDDALKMLNTSEFLKRELAKYIKEEVKESDIEKINNVFVQTIIQLYIDTENIKVIYDELEEETEENDDKINMDPFNLYLRDISRFPLLTKEEEVEIFTEYRNGNLELKKTISERNQRLIVSIAKHFITEDYDMLSAIQDGNLGMMRAIKDFDVTKGYKFSTYATWWIRQSITREKMNTDRTIRIPVHLRETMYKYKKLAEQFSNDYGTSLGDEEAMQILGISERNLKLIQFYLVREPSLNTMVDEDHEESELGDFIADETFMGPEDSAISQSLKTELHKILDTLSSREQMVINERFGLIDGREKTLEEVGRMVGVTRERIRQIEFKALKKIKRRGEHLRSFVDDRY